MASLMRARASMARAARNDTEENIETLAQERELPSVPVVVDYPCPDILWQGRFAQIAERLGKHSWEVWMGTLCAMGAVAHKHLYWHYYRPLYGMVYGLLIAPTSSGKGTVADVCAALLPEHYTVRDSIQSGQALFPILANVKKDSQGKILSIHPRPAMLLIEEWTTLVKASKMEFSQLQETLNNLFHRKRPWNVSRSDAERSGGDRIVENPTLSICATTTDSLLQQCISPAMIRSGFLNRYLIVPGSRTPWKYFDPDRAKINADRVKGYLDDLASYEWGDGAAFDLAYTTEARAAIDEWGTPFFEPLMAKQDLEAESLKRLHLYSHVIAFLYAWSEQASLVTKKHVEAAIAVCEVSKLFVESLVADDAGDVMLPQYKQYEVTLEHKILAKVQREPGVTVKAIANDLRRNALYKDIVEMVRSLTKSDRLRIDRRGKSEHVHVIEYRE